MLDTENRVVKLKDGRLLGYAEYGDLNGKPIFYFHGWPSSRLEARDLHKRAKDFGIRIIAIDRPGMGLSDYKDDRTILEWPKDVVELADYLTINKFGVLGAGSGGLYVLACAHEISHKLSAVGLVNAMSTLTTTNAPNFVHNQELNRIALARKFPALAKLMIWWNLHKVEHSNGNFFKYIKDFSDSDKTLLLNRPDIREHFIDMRHEAHHHGLEGIIHDIKLEGRPLGFNLEEISVDVYLWQGEDDNVVYPAMAYYLAREIPKCHPIFLAHEGHISALSNHTGEILSVML